jgi:small conductance mechanosensitive channel
LPEKEANDRFQPNPGKIWELVTLYGLKIIAAIVILLIGRWVAIAIHNIIRRLMRRGDVDQTIRRFVANLTYAILLVLIVLAALNQLGIQTTSSLQF